MCELNNELQQRLKVDLQDRSALRIESIESVASKELLAFKLGRLGNEFGFSAEMGMLGFASVRAPICCSI